MITVKELKEALSILNEDSVVMLAINSFPSEKTLEDGELYMFPLDNMDYTDINKLSEERRENNLDIEGDIDSSRIDDYMQTLENKMAILITHIPKEKLQLKYTK